MSPVPTSAGAVAASRALVVLWLALTACRPTSPRSPTPTAASADSAMARQRMAEMTRWVDSAATAMGITSAGEVDLDGPAITSACESAERITLRQRGDSAVLASHAKADVVLRRTRSAGTAYTRRPVGGAMA